MKVFAISDLHLSINSNKPMDIFGPVWDDNFNKIRLDWEQKVSNEDIVLLAGDLSWAMKLEDALEDIKLLDELNGKKIILKGNHDYWWQGITQLRSCLPKDFYAIQNDALKIENIVFCGTRGWNIPEGKYDTEENRKIYKREVERLKLSLQNMQKLREENDKVICLMHYPPFNAKLEDTDFTKLLEEFNVDYVVFGHIHGNKYGYKTISSKNGITYFLTSCDLINNNLIKIL